MGLQNGENHLQNRVALHDSQLYNLKVKGYLRPYMWYFTLENENLKLTSVTKVIAHPNIEDGNSNPEQGI